MGTFVFRRFALVMIVVRFRRLGALAFFVFLAAVVLLAIVATLRGCVSRRLCNRHCPQARVAPTPRIDTAHVCIGTTT